MAYAQQGQQQPFAPGPGGMTPGVAAVAEPPKKPHLYVGNLSPRVNDFMLSEIFGVAGTVVSAKIIQDRNVQHGGYNYGFVEYSDMRGAEAALQTLNGRKIFEVEVKVNWAYQGQTNKEDTQHHFHVFVGDLSPEVNDEVLGKAFGAFGSMSEARVMWDMNSGKSRGYGFLSFREKADAEQAINTMNGEWLGTRAIRVNWANQKTQTSGRSGGGPGGPGGPGGGPSFSPSPMGATPMHMGYSSGPSGMASPYQAPSSSYSAAPAQTYEAVAAQSSEYNTTVYVGNLIPYTTQADLIPLFQGYGYIVEIRMQADRGFAFIKLDSHHNAAMAITHLQNHLVHGRPLKCSWGKDKGPEGAGGAPSGLGAPMGLGAKAGSTSPAPAAAGSQYGAMGYPSHNQYAGYYGGGYGYGQSGVPGQPGQAATTSAETAWDPAAAQAYYQQTAGWGNYYSTDSTTGGAGSAQSGQAGSR